ncbi:PREDICTED: uncharacterized protein LOC106814220 [Priapulus caudatus]|uniref:Uncharacterized protein LOC106814220 n=1 Tax=Priapulus caudatus TaxID=37621 RepID=A0ABM1EP85_PRICU|nr:PREDICTED: uncharacterized protein LOC106814220 [Priapulus caudatus]
MLSPSALLPFLLHHLLLLLLLGTALAELAPPCDPDACRLPDCRCDGVTSSPGGLRREQTPQMVVLTFDDHFNHHGHADLRRLRLFDLTRVNPTGCPVGATFFVSHTATDYIIIEEYYLRGHEIGVHSITTKIHVNEHNPILTTKILMIYVPLVSWSGTEDGEECSMMDDGACTQPQTADEMVEWMWSNFLRHYDTNRAPFSVFLHARYFRDYPYALEGMNMFLDRLSQHDDVFLVTVGQVVEWMRHPAPLSDIATFKPWQCDRVSLQRPTRCVRTLHATCAFRKPVTYLNTCSPCPCLFPGLGNPAGSCEDDV